MNFELSASPYSLSGPLPGFGRGGLGFGAELSGSVSLEPLGESPSASAAPQLVKAHEAVQEVKKLSIVLPKDVHQRAKLLALKEDITLTSLIIDLLRDRIKAADL